MTDELKDAQKRVNNELLGSAFPHGELSTDNGVYVPDVGFSKKEYAAIHLKIPMSGNDEIDAMIKRARRDELAKAAMLAVMSTYEYFSGKDEMVEAAYEMVDAMIEEGEK